MRNAATQGAGGHSERAAARLSGQCRLLLLVQTLYTIANALSGTFVSIYLWKVKNDYGMIAQFFLATQLLLAAFFWLAGKWVKEANKMNTLRAGIAVSALFYAGVLLLGPKAVHYVWLLGGVQGAAMGLFWAAANVVYFEVTDPDTRDRFNGWGGLLGSLAGMLAPWISGFLITRMTASTGYRLIFSLSLAIFLGTVVLSFFLKKRPPLGRYDWFYGFRQLARPRHPWRRIGAAMAAQGVREGVFSFLIGLLVYIATRNEQKLGNFSLITSGVSLVSFWAVGHWLKPRYRKFGMLAGIAMSILVLLPFFHAINYTTLLLFGIGTSLFLPLLLVPSTSIVFDLIGRSEDNAERRVEYIVLRELLLSSGRVAGTVLFLVLLAGSVTPMRLNVFLLATGSAPLLTWFFLRPWLGPGGAGGDESPESGQAGEERTTSAVRARHRGARLAEGAPLETESGSAGEEPEEAGSAACAVMTKPIK
ncbi:MFS transporter [Paenibacillus sp. J31TS4]|uniref:MFS transporter n=1 Tax=Paenibacillus sp. J31TS4 TaxID=2807195 RepID=UPI001AFF6244|nr:MFS transporter [Paenibacillus sp. J31TS4]GIP38795.1 MFS transporter [Paenibacillus sp. J31TS4]